MTIPFGHSDMFIGTRKGNDGFRKVDTLEKEWKTGMVRNVNIDYIGIRNLMHLLEQLGFSAEELKRIDARIVAQLGATIILK